MYGPVDGTSFPYAATRGLIALNVLVFAAMLWYGAGLWHTPNQVQLAWGASFGPATKEGEWWRLGTAVFLHFGLLHLAMNMWALWDAGRLVERLCGAWRLVVLFFASGLTGNLLSLIAQGDRAVSGGASGAVFGIYGALMVSLWVRRRDLDPVDFRWLFGGALVFTAATIAFGLLIPGIDNAAHVGGLVSGALVGLMLTRSPSADAVWLRRARWIAAAVFGAAVAGMVAAIPAPAYRWSEEQQAREGLKTFAGEDQRLAQRWQSILETGRRGGASFDEIATRIENDVTREYRESFEQLSALQLDPAAPSAASLEVARRYAQLRAEAAHEFAEGLRTQDRARMREAMELARRAPYLARGEEAPPPPPHPIPPTSPIKRP